MKKLLAFVLATAMALSMAACGGAKDSNDSSTPEPSNDQVYELKLAGSMPTDSPSSQGMERIKAYCEEKSGGRLKITTYPANQLGDSTLVIEDIMAGNVDMGCFFIGTSYDARIAINSLPYLATSVEDAKRIYSPGSHYFDAYSKVLADLDIKLLGTHGDGFVGLLYTKYPKNYNDPNVRHDLLIRMAANDAYRLALESMQYNSTTIAFSDLYTSLQTGVCDGAIGLTPVSAQSSFGDLVKYWVPYKLFIDPLDYTISQKTWDSLPEDLQQIIQDAVTEVTNQQFENMETLDQEYLDKMVGQGCEVLPLTDEEFNSFVEKVRADSWSAMAKLVGQDLIDEVAQDLQ